MTSLITISPFKKAETYHQATACVPCDLEVTAAEAMAETAIADTSAKTRVTKKQL